MYVFKENRLHNSLADSSCLLQKQRIFVPNILRRIMLKNVQLHYCVQLKFPLYDLCLYNGIWFGISIQIILHACMTRNEEKSINLSVPKRK